MTEMLNTLQLHFDGRYAEQYLAAEHFRRTGATHTDTENLIDECQRIASIDVAILMVEQPNGDFRFSLRSKGQTDVRQVAQRYGGGGHTMASGVTLKGPLETAKKNVLDAINEQLK